MPEQAIKRFGEAVRNARHQRRISQQELADLTGISKRHIAKIENGISNPSLEIVAILSCYLTLSVDKVLYGEHISNQDTYMRQIGILLSKLNDEEKSSIFQIVEILVHQFEHNGCKKD